MACRKKRLVLGLAFLWAEFGVEGKEEKEEHNCHLLGKFDLSGYVDAQNHSLVIGGLFPIHYRTVPANESFWNQYLQNAKGKLLLSSFSIKREWWG